nr:hypothetical protein Iba_chr07aCG6250 [Ipomoea batatas]
MGGALGTRNPQCNKMSHFVWLVGEECGRKDPKDMMCSHCAGKTEVDEGEGLGGLAWLSINLLRSKLVVVLEMAHIVTDWLIICPLVNPPSSIWCQGPTSKPG